MTAPVLKRSLGEAGAFFDDSHGEDRLLAILTALANQGQVLSTRQAGLASTGIKAATVVPVDSVLGLASLNMGTAGTGGQTDLTVNIDGVAQTPVTTVLNGDPDGETKTADMAQIAVPAGSVVDLELTAVAAVNADMTASVAIKPVSVE
jgi:hypothetical protein